MTSSGFGGRPTDSSGVSWTGRSLSETDFPGDTGDADPALLEALLARASRPSVERDEELMRLVGAARLIVPVVAIPALVDRSGDLDADTSTTMAVVTLTAPDGRRALPVFSSVAALSAWDPAGRPVPVPAARAAQAAVAEGCQVVVIDVGAAHATELRPSMVWGLSQGREWVPAHRDPFVLRSVASAVDREEHVRRHLVEDGEPAGTGILQVVLGLTVGLGPADVEAIATRVGERLATDGEFRGRVDELTFSLARG